MINPSDPCNGAPTMQNIGIPCRLDHGSGTEISWKKKTISKCQQLIVHRVMEELMRKKIFSSSSSKMKAARMMLGEECAYIAWAERLRNGVPAKCDSLLNITRLPDGLE